MDIYNSEDGTDWNNFFFKLQERGLTGVQLVREQWKDISKIVSEALMDESVFKIAIDRMEGMKLDKSIDMLY